MFPIVEAFGKTLDRAYAEDAHEVGAALRGHADQGRRRGAPVPLAQRRVRRLRALGQGQPRRQRRRRRTEMLEFEYARSALQERAEARAAARRQPVQVRPRQRRATRTPASPRWRRTTSSARPRRRSRAPSACAPRSSRIPRPASTSWTGRSAPPATPRCGPPRTRARRIWDAMQRRETYSTTGPRMVVRFFGGWEFEAAGRPHARCPADAGYAKGVPMGGDLSEAPAGKAPTLPRRRAARSDRRQPRPHPDRQGLDRREGRAAGEGLRRRLGAVTGSPARMASCRPSAAPWTWRTRPGPTPSARPS